jgi:hypothetical protein
LKTEPESYLAYLHGQKLDRIAHLTQKVPRTRGVFKHCLAFIKFLLKTTSLFKTYSPETDRPYDFLFFAGTQNQIDSLNPVLSALSRKTISSLALSKPRDSDLDSGEIKYRSIQFSASDSIKAIVLLLLRGPSLVIELRRKPNEVRHWYFIQFCMCYAYVPYFLRILRATSPKIVVVANDHSVPNRSLIAGAHYLGIKTAYLQHASVSPLFPALRFDYAFLDGKSAMDTYRECECNTPPSEASVRSAPSVFLSGQKKSVGARQVASKGPIGLAINALDDPSLAVRLCQSLVGVGYSVRLRWHPAQKESDVQMLMAGVSALKGVELSNPKKCRVSQFLSGLMCLVAGNSSIHLEAALAGVHPLYYELSPADSPDYYGYVRSGLAVRVEGIDGLLQALENKDVLSDTEGYLQAVRYYSATYLTEWDGKEGELVADALIQLGNGTVPDEVWGYEPWPKTDLYSDKGYSVEN